MDSKPGNFVIATVIVLIGAGLVDKLLSTFVSVDFAKAVSSLTLTTVPYVKSMLDNRSIKPRPGLLPKGIVRPERFWLPWEQLVVYGTFIFIAAIEVTGFIVGVTSAWLFGEPSFDNLVMALVPSAIFTSGFTAFFIGRWIGTRVNRNGILTIILVVLLGRILAVLGDFFMLGEANLGGPRTVSYFFQMMTDGMSLFLILTMIGLVFGLIGYRRGYQMRLFDYVGYLLGTLPTDTRDTIIDLIYDETKRLSPSPEQSAKSAVST